MIAILVVQLASLLVRRTRLVSITSHGFADMPFIIAMLVETIVMILLCYLPGINTAFGTRMLAFPHFALPAFSFFMIIIFYEEFRKLQSRKGIKISRSTGRAKYVGWFAKNTVY